MCECGGRECIGTTQVPVFAQPESPSRASYILFYTFHSNIYHTDDMNVYVVTIQLNSAVQIAFSQHTTLVFFFCVSSGILESPSLENRETMKRQNDQKREVRAPRKKFEFPCPFNNKKQTPLLITSVSQRGIILRTSKRSSW